MSTVLNSYTINDFIELKPIIYEYCVNLTQKKTSTSWFRDFQDADDLYQEVFLYVYDNYFNKPKELMHKGKFVQIMKNCTYWTYHRRFTRPNAAVYSKLNRIDDSPKDFYLFEEVHSALPVNWLEFKDSIDFKYYTRNLSDVELKAIDMFLEGHPIKEIDEKLGFYRGKLENIIKKKLKKEVVKEPINLIDIEKVKKEKIELIKKTINKNHEEVIKNNLPNFDLIFPNKRNNRGRDRYIEIYSLYLQKIPNMGIAKIVNKSANQVAQEIYRINKKIKKYGITK